MRNNDEIGSEFRSRKKHLTIKYERIKRVLATSSSEDQSATNRRKENNIEKLNHDTTGGLGGGATEGDAFFWNCIGEEDGSYQFWYTLVAEPG